MQVVNFIISNDTPKTITSRISIFMASVQYTLIVILYPLTHGPHIYYSLYDFIVIYLYEYIVFDMTMLYNEIRLCGNGPEFGI